MTTAAERIAQQEREFRNTLALDPRNLTALLGLARLALLQERVEEGFALLRRLEETKPAHPEGLALTGIYWCRLGELQAKLGRVNEGIQSLLRAIRANRRFVRPYLVVGALCERTGKIDLMMRLYCSGLRHNPHAIPLLERLASIHASKFQFPQALALALKIVERRNLCGDSLRLGTYAVALGKLDMAEKAFQCALAQNPNSWEAHYNLAELYMSAGLMDQAGEHYRAALDCGPDRYEPLNGIGLFTLTVDRDPFRAIEHLRRAIRIAPFRAEAHLNLALAHAKTGELAAAEASAVSALSLAKPADRIYQQAERLMGTLMLQKRSFHALR